MMRRRDSGKSLAWALGWSVALAMHLAVAAALVYQPYVTEDDDAPAGSYVVELAPEFTSAPSPAVALPIGILSSESAESAAAVAAAPTEPVVTETPPVEPSPVEPEAALPQKQDKKSDQPPPDPSRQSDKSDSAAFAASVAAAPPPAEAPPAPVAKAPHVGMSPSARRARTSWHRAIALHLERYKRFPAAASATRSAGTVQVAFTINREGVMAGARVVASSGLEILDAAALDLLSRAGALPPAPPEVAGTEFSLAVPIVFKLP